MIPKQRSPWSWHPAHRHPSGFATSNAAHRGAMSWLTLDGPAGWGLLAYPCSCRVCAYRPRHARAET